MAEPNQFFDGFEGLSATAGCRLLDFGWYTYGNYTNVTYPNGRFAGNKGISTWAATGLSGQSQYALVARTFEDSTAHEYFAMAVAFKWGEADWRSNGGLPTSDLDKLGMYPLHVMYDVNTVFASHLGTRINNDGSISICRRTGLTYNGWTELSRTRANAIQAQNWTFLSWRGRIHATAGESTLRINGTEMVEATFNNLNTKFGGPLAVSCALGTQGVHGPDTGVFNIDQNVMQFDDYVMNSSGVYIPERRIDPLLANGDGGTLNLVPSTGSSHFGVVDESIADLTDYLSGSNVGDLDLLDIQNMAFVPSVIDGVRVKAILAKTDANTRAWRLGIKSGATVGGVEDQYVSVTPAGYDEFYWTDPNTAGAWSPTAINALQFRPSITI